MERDEPGLRHRLRRIAAQIQHQHEQLASLERELAQARDATSDRAGSLIERYRAALAAHFELEEGMFFPALHGYAPDEESALAGLLEEHVKLTQQLDALAGASPAAAWDALSTFLDALERHEDRETALWARVR